MALGLRRAGFRSLWCGDLDPRAVATAQAAGFPAEVLRLDALSAAALAGRLQEDVDLVAGGPPCQGLSVAGKGLGKYDPRDGFPAMLALVRETRPKAVLIENVKGLTSGRHRPYLGEIVADMEALGYVVPRCPDRDWPGRVHDAADFGAPQRRHRILIVAFRDPAAAARFRWPEPTHHQSGLVWAKWGPAGEERGGIVGGSYWAGHGMDAPAGAPSRDEARVLRETLGGRLEVRGPRWRTVRDALGGTLLTTERGDRAVSIDSPHPTIAGHRPGGGGASTLLLTPPAGQARLPQSMRAENPDRPSSTVQGGGGESHHAPAVLGIVGDAGASRVAAGRIVGLDEPSVAVRGGSVLKGGAGGGILWATAPDHPGAERAVDLDAGTPTALVRNTALHRAPEIVDADAPAKAVRDEGRDQFLTPAQVALLAAKWEGGYRTPDDLDIPSRTIQASEGKAGAKKDSMIVDHADLLGIACRRDVTDEPSSAMVAEQVGNRGPWVAQEIRYPTDGSHGTAGTEPGRLDEPSVTVTAMEAKGTRAHPGAGWDFHGGPDRAGDGVFRAIGLRRLTPAECAALQQFPEDWPWQGPRTAIYRGVGNACPPPLAEAIGQSLAAVLSEPCRTEPPPRRPWQSTLFGLA